MFALLNQIISLKRMDTGKSIYVIKNENTGFVKIGVTNNLKIRLMGLQTSCGCKMDLVYYTVPMLNYSEIEILMHKTFSGYRGIGEWFDVDSELIIKELKSSVDKFELSGFVKMYIEGEKIGVIADYYGVTYQYIHKLVVHCGMDGTPDKSTILSDIKYKNEKDSIVPKGKFTRVKSNISTNGVDYEVSFYKGGRLIKDYFKSLVEAESYLDQIKSKN